MSEPVPQGAAAPKPQPSDTTGNRDRKLAAMDKAEREHEASK